MSLRSTPPITILAISPADGSGLGDEVRAVLHAYTVLWRDEQGQMCSVIFANPTDALTAAIALLKLQPLRLALHTDTRSTKPAQVSEVAIDRAHQICAAAHPEQLLLSETTHHVLGEQIPSDVSLRFLGSYRLADLLRPEALSQVVTPTLPQDFPELLTLDRLPHNFPPLSTRFIGHEHELAAACRLLQQGDTRLLTIVAPSGTGKTYFSLQVGVNTRQSFADGVYFVALAPIDDPVLVISTIAHTVGVKETSTRSLMENLIEYLQNRKMLLLLDNFEQVVAAAAIVSELLAATKHIRVIVSSHIPLGIAGEQVMALAPLALPDPSAVSSAAQVLQHAAIRLFVERAQDINPEFALSETNAADIVAICQHLRGLPLALAIISSTSDRYIPATLRMQIEARFPAIVESDSELKRQAQVLRSALDWAYEHVLPDEQRLFERLGAFAGGSTLEAAEAICNPDNDLDLDVLDAVQALARRNLLDTEELDEGELRFIMLDCILNYARQRLQARGEMPLIRQRHSAYYLALAESAVPELLSMHQQAWFNRLESENHNLRAALAWSCDQHQVEQALRLSYALWPFWELWGALREAEQSLLRALALAGSPPQSSVEARLLALGQQSLGSVYDWQGRYTEAWDMTERAHATFVASDDRRALGRTLGILGHIKYQQGDYKAAYDYYSQRQTIATELGDRYELRDALYYLAGCAWATGQYQEALQFCQQSLDLESSSDSYRTTGSVLKLIGITYEKLGDIAQAIDAYRRALDVYRQHSTRRDLCHVIGNMGSSYGLCGQTAQMIMCFQRSLNLALEYWGADAVGWTAAELALGMSKAGQLAVADDLFSCAISLLRSIKHRYLLYRALSYWTDARYRQGQILEAVEGMQEAAALNQQYTFLPYVNVVCPPELRLLQLQVAQQQCSLEEGMQRIAELRQHWTTKEQQAILDYMVWQLDSTREAERQRAAASYQQLYTHTQIVFYRTCYQELSGLVLPDPPSLPDLPTVITEDLPPLAILLPQLEERCPLAARKP